MIRGLCSFTSVSLLYLSVSLMPLSNSVVLQFMSPLFVAVAAPLVLGEQPNKWVLHETALCEALHFCMFSSIYFQPWAVHIRRTSIMPSALQDGVGRHPGVYHWSHFDCTACCPVWWGQQWQPDCRRRVRRPVAGSLCR